MSQIRVLAERGATAYVLSRPEVNSSVKERSFSAYAIEQLLRAVHTAGVFGQFYALQTLTAPTRVTDEV